MLSKVISKFRRSTSGSFAPIFGIAAIPIMLSIGIAVDYANISRIKSSHQNLLDSAVLDGALQTEKSDIKKIIRKHYKSDREDQSIPVTKVKKTDDGNLITSTVELTVKNAFMAIINQPETKIAIESQVLAPFMLSSIKVEPTYGKGWWSKTATVMVKQKGEDEYKSVASIDYQYDRPNNSHTLTAIPENKWVELGNYDHAYIKFEIDPNSFGWSPKFCGACITDIRSDDPEFSDRVYLDGVQFPKGVVVDMFTLVPCGSSLQEWEDGGGMGADFGFEIEGRCNLPNPETIRLTK